MNTDAHEWESGLTEAVIGSTFEAANEAGAGFVEKVYELALIRFANRHVAQCIGYLAVMERHGIRSILSVDAPGELKPLTSPRQPDCHPVSVRRQP